MPNHFHILIKDIQKQTIKYMKSLQGAYAIFHNCKYKRSGHLFEGRYKNKEVKDEIGFHQLENYINNNPVKDGLVKNIKDWPYTQTNIPI
jgi:REP element-mobilizing transposase RayT